MSASSRSSEAFRRECEARYWLKQTGGRKAEVDEVIYRIGERRGRQAAAILRQDMRDEWLSQKPGPRHTPQQPLTEPRP